MIKNQPNPKDSIEVLELTNVIYEKICSMRNQSKVINVVYIYIKKRNKFREEIRDIQNKNIIEFKKVYGTEFWKKNLEFKFTFL